MKRIFMVFLLMFLSLGCTVGGTILFTGCNTTQEQPENGGGGILDPDDEETDKGEQNPTESPEEDIEGKKTSFNFTIKILARYSATGYDFAGTNTYDTAGGAGYFTFGWYDQNYNAANLTADSKAYYPANGMTVTQSGGDKGTTITYNLKYMQYAFSSGSNYRRFGQIFSYEKDSNYEGCGVSTSTSNDNCRSSVYVGTQIYGAGNITTNVSTAKSGCSTSLSGTYYVVFRKKYTATYYGNGGSNVPSTQSFYAGIGYNLSTKVPTRTGYTFTGWTRGSVASGTYYQPGHSFSDGWASSSDTWYANWAAKNYNVTFNSNGGSNVTASNSVNSYLFDVQEFKDFYDTSYYNLNGNRNSIVSIISDTTTPTIRFSANVGYNWNLNNGAGDYVVYNPNLPPGDYKLSYTADHDRSDSNISTGIMPKNKSGEYILKTGKLYVSTSSPTYYSGTFTVDSNFAGFVLPWHYGDSTLFQNVELKCTSKAIKKVAYGSSYGTLPTPTKTGYNFVGWFTAQSGGTQITSTSIVGLISTYQTLYAHWEIKTYTFTYSIMYFYGLYDTDYLVSSTGGVVSNLKVQAEYSTSPIVVTFTCTNDDFEYCIGAGSAPSVGTTYVNNYSYVWTPTIDKTIFLYIYQKYTYKFDGNGNTGGSVPYDLEILHDKGGTLPSNNLTRTGYTANGWNVSSLITSTPSYQNGATVNGPSMTLYANWKANSYTVYFDENGGSSVSDKTVTYDSTYGTLPTPTRAGCTFGGWYTNENFTTQVTSATVVKTARNHTLYAKWLDDGANDLKYDSTEKYFYFEDGVLPQTYVGTSMNNTLNSSGAVQIGEFEYFNGKSDITIPIYLYSGLEYAKLTAGKTMTLTLSGGSFTFTSGQDYWFKVEPIRWRVSEYGVSSTAYPSGFASYGSTKTNFTVVSDRILTVGAVTNADTKEGWSFTSSKLYSDVLAISRNGTSYHVTNGSVSYDKYASASGNIKVTSSNVVYTGIHVASEADVKTNLSDKSAKASDMVKFLLGTSSEYVDYWTRDLVTLDNGKVITKIGESVSRWLDKMAGVRFAMTMKEGVRVSQS